MKIFPLYKIFTASDFVYELKKNIFKCNHSVQLFITEFDLLADLREIRVLRFLSLLKYEPASKNIAAAFNRIKKELIIFTVLAIFILYVAAVGIYHFENPVQPDKFPDIFHSMWWAVATLTTVGYGDVFPITGGGKLFASVVVYVGLGLVALPAGLIGGAFSEAFSKDK